MIRKIFLSSILSFGIALPQIAVAQGSSSSFRPWRAPEYDGQHQAMGWSPMAFSVPAGLEDRVRFWVDIYSKYTTHQGVIHDVDKLNKIYGVVDFQALDESKLPPRLKDRLRQKAIDEAKKRIAHQLGPHFDLSSLRYQLGQKDRMEAAIVASGRYLPEFENVFRDAGLPVELTRLVFVESSFNVMARSKVGASGLWQLMPSAVKPYGLINLAVDGRNHPLTATKMAAKILLGNYRRLGSWPLALTAYNHGVNGMARMIEMVGSRDLSTLIKSDELRTVGKNHINFGFASKNFYASFLAAYEVEKRAPMYFPGIAWARPFDGEQLKIPRPVRYADILHWFHGNAKLLEMMNPHLTSNARKGREIPSGTTLMIPSGQFDLALLKFGRKGLGSDEKRSPASDAETPRSPSAKNYLAK